MNCRIIGLVGWLACTHWLAAENIKLATLKDGATTYTNVTITTVTATDIYFKHNGGMGNVKLRYLDPELQQRFHYDPEAAAATPSPSAGGYTAYQTAVASGAASAPAATDNSPPAPAPDSNPFADSVSENSQIGKPVPDINVEKWFSDKPLATTGKCVIILFWTSQSEACRHVIPELNALQKKYAENLVVIGITPETDRDLSQAADLNIDFYYGSDPKSVTSRTVGVTSVPTVLFVDSKGLIRYQGHPAALKEDAVERFFINK